MMNHPSPGLRGVRRYILEPSSNRLAEQCDVAHLARTLVHFPPQGEPPWPHPSQFEYTPHTKKNMHTESNSSSSCCTILFISDVHNDHDMNYKHIFILRDVKTFKYIKNIYKYCDILFFYVATYEGCAVLYHRKLENTNVEVFSFLSHLRQEVKSSTTASNPFKLFKQVTDHTAHWSGFSWTFLNFSDIYDSPSVNCFLASPCFYPNSKRIK